MKITESTPAVLLLQDGTLFHGKALGKIGTHGGEICFNTGMTGYQEIYTDPSYAGQVIINTTAHIGNYGVMDAQEAESNQVQIAGMVCNEFSSVNSRFTATGSLQDYLENAGIVGISGIDTRALVRHIRTKGVMNCLISSEIFDIDSLQKELAKVPDMEGLELSSQVCTQETYFLGDENAELKVAVLDLGVKKSILSNLTDRGCYLKVFPAKTSYDEIAAWQPDGYFVSNGPGDPAVMPYAVATVSQFLASDKPVFGICLGHQILAQVCGLSTYKMHNGHRGLNHPVKNLETGLSEITSQNHGFAVRMEELSVSSQATLTHINLNDQTVEGLRVNGKKAFSVQHHPEASPGPHDSRYLFDQFIGLMK
ncbi:glutamine-hydrolyzing carbamoyl-phosphate synthase small subunit [Aquirufa nivalisilvae]|uniref:Carbamoyl phosphate synthase small chain n=1 Tax=Aquirufa nivalisilvae TaxID=2516557 RepID=A0A2S2DY31_9BACT|nr:glutamine-hydrolyzing carbamoyl-phosphate synthase small subunit [Aquirufa nivalisilvae]AWL10249.1 Carbamoyl-phosphate synthase (glutamine-hydrolyzing) [Aquirufa nivalisilvae]MCZ2479855.1 glutamine-hydrolyzing carbamoyl-phosphate synthase small subunit [Aquirufa nivalisilvae]TBH76079.1 carbamoyl-phosphate synthase small subunit [Aquirufa nivalisilvae]